MTLSEAHALVKGRSLVRQAERIIAAHDASRDARRKRDRAAKERAPRAKGTTPAERRKTKAEARRATRPLVEARENGTCAVSALGGCRGRLIWDHFFGRGKVPPSVELEWMLCEEHDRQKTASEPSRLEWAERFLLHAIFHEYTGAQARCHAAISLEFGQHPAPAIPKDAP